MIMIDATSWLEMPNHFFSTLRLQDLGHNNFLSDVLVKEIS